MASTTSFDRKGLRFGMDSSPASAEEKGSTQAKKRRKTETESGEGLHNNQSKESMQNNSRLQRAQREEREEGVSYRPTLRLLGAPWSPTVTRTGKTVGRRGHCPSSPHCG